MRRLEGAVMTDPNEYKKRRVCRGGVWGYDVPKPCPKCGTADADSYFVKDIPEWVEAEHTELENVIRKALLDGFERSMESFK